MKVQMRDIPFLLSMRGLRRTSPAAEQVGRPARVAGFTLIEVLVAMGVAALANHAMTPRGSLRKGTDASED